MEPRDLAEDNAEIKTGTNKVDTEERGRSKILANNQKPLKKNVREEPKITEINKHRTNINEVLRWSNATPIRRYDDMGYMCCFCKEQYRIPADLKIHTIQQHPVIYKACFMKLRMDQFYIRLDITALTCKICNINIETVEQLMTHLKDEHQKLIYTDIKNHMMPFKFQTNSDDLQCCMCTLTFTKFRMLLEHMHEHYKNYICEICDKGFFNIPGLRRHKLTHEMGDFKCDYCEKIYDTNVKKRAHERFKHLPKRGFYKCVYCTEVFKDYRQKDDHLESRHGMKLPRCKCQACDMTFKSRRSLNIHVRRDHLMDKRFKCSVCDMGFFKSAGLKDHMITHTGSRDFKCTVCSKTFCRLKSLREHMKIHNDDRRFKCEHCGQAFVQKCSWKLHLKSKHGVIV